MAIVDGWGRGTWGESSWGSNIPVVLTGQGLTASLSSVTAISSVTVNVTGQSLTSAVGSPLIISWSNVDPGVTNTWTEVDIAA